MQTEARCMVILACMGDNPPDFECIRLSLILECGEEIWVYECPAVMLSFPRDDDIYCNSSITPLAARSLTLAVLDTPITLPSPIT